MDIIWLGLIAGAITSFGFIPQIIKGFLTKKLEDVSYFMPMVLIIGMFLWLIYGIFRADLAIVAANIFAIACNVTLILMKNFFEKKSAGTGNKI